VRCILSGKVKDRLKGFVKRLFPSDELSEPSVIQLRREHLWSIGIYIGNSPFDFASPENITNPVLSNKDVSDVPALFIADPFMIEVNHMWYMFFEVMNKTNLKGEIGLAISNDGFKWVYQQIVVAESFHLSYPYTFELMGNYYMIPESYQAGFIRLYKAVKFPTQWEFIGNLLSGPYYADSSLFYHDKKWWLFAETNPDLKHDTLRLYYAENLTGPWSEHMGSPIIAGNAHIARPAGRVLIFNGRIIRYAQDCDPIYGTQVRAFEITDLTATNYQERAIGESPILRGSGTGWNECGMHHIDPHPIGEGRWIACVDGFLWQEYGAYSSGA
jgi:hypothetical protein